MRTTVLTVLTTVALVLVTLGPAAALQEASQLSTGDRTIGKATSTAVIGPRRQQDRGIEVAAQTFDIRKRRDEHAGIGITCGMRKNPMKSLPLR